MGGRVGDLITKVIVGGSTALEELYPMPKRLGTPLPRAAQPDGKADPVVLVGGFSNGPGGWDEWVRSLRGDGFDAHVFDLPSRGLGDMRESGKLLADYLQSVKRATGRDKLDVVGFSEGGLLARMAVGQLGRAGDVDRLIGLATPNAGISLLRDTYMKRPELARWVDQSMPAFGQLLEGSKVIGEIAAGDAPLRAAKQGVRYASIYSRANDNMVTAKSAKLDGALNIPIAPDEWWHTDPNHFAMYHLSDRAYVAARELLLDRPDAGAVAIGTSGKY